MFRTNRALLIRVASAAFGLVLTGSALLSPFMTETAAADSDPLAGAFKADLVATAYVVKNNVGSPIDDIFGIYAYNLGQGGYAKDTRADVIMRFRDRENGQMKEEYTQSVTVKLGDIRHKGHVVEHVECKPKHPWLECHSFYVRVYTPAAETNYGNNEAFVKQ